MLLIIFIVVVVVGAFYFIYNKGIIATIPFVTNNKVISSNEEKILVEKYIRENIKTIAPEEPVLGGAWYVTSVNIDTLSKTGNMTYEDGHIDGKAAFTYTLDGGKVLISTVQKIMQ